MKNKLKKRRTTIVALLLIVFVFSSLSYAANNKKVLEAWYGTTNILYNGKNVTKEFEPFIANGTTYVPMRTISTIFNKTVGWNEKTATATITDKNDVESVQFQNTLLLKDIEISELKQKIEDLEKDLYGDGGSSSRKSIKNLEKDLRSDYDRYERIDFDISLRTSNKDKDIDVRIEVDLDRDDYRWDDLSTRKKEDYVEDICNDILREYKDASITGYIRDTYDRKDLITFYTKSNGSVVVDFESNRDRDKDRDRDISIRDLERDLDDRYHDHFSDVPLDITISGNSKNIEYTVEVDYGRYKKEWKDLSDSKVERLMEDIYYDIDREYSKAEIEGYIYDTDGRKHLGRYYKKSNGKKTLNRY